MLDLSHNQKLWAALIGLALGLAGFALLQHEPAPSPPQPETLETAISAYWAGDFASAERILKKGSTSEASSAEALLADAYLAATLAGLGRGNEAEAAFTALLRTDAHFAPEPKLGAQAAVKSAFDQAKRVVAAEHKIQGDKAFRAGNLDEAAAHAKIALTLDPRHRGALELEARLKKPKVSAPPPMPQPTGTGWLNLNSKPWAEVSIDGKPVGPTPLRRFELQAGTHRVRLRLSGPTASSKELRVVIQPDKVTTHSVTFPSSATEPP